MQNWSLIYHYSYKNPNCNFNGQLVFEFKVIKCTIFVYFNRSLIVDVCYDFCNHLDKPNTMFPMC